MIPFLPQPFFQINQTTIMMFDIMGILAIVTFKRLLQKRSETHGLESKVSFDLFLIALIIGLPFAHIFSILWNMPQLVWKNPLILIQLNRGLDSTGGFIGYSFGVLIYFLLNAKKDLPWLSYLDSVAYAVCGALLCFRIGCAFAHDHPGQISSSLLAIQYPDWLYGGTSRHNLGLDEAIGLIFIFFILHKLDKKPHQDGLIITVFLFLYSILRFFLDFLRSTDLPYSDERFIDLTLAQWGCILLFVVTSGIFLTKLSYTLIKRGTDEP